jgi:bacterioferritin
MKGNDQIIARLNETLIAEFTAIHQYFIHAEMEENWGYKKLSSYVRRQSIDEMKHAEKLIERILFLDGVPSMGELKPLNVGEDVKTQLENDLQVEYDAVQQLNVAVAEAREAGDNGSRELFEMILVDEEDHVDWLEAQLQSIADMGIGLYLAQHLEPGQ